VVNAAAINKTIVLRDLLESLECPVKMVCPVTMVPRVKLELQEKRTLFGLHEMDADGVLRVQEDQLVRQVTQVARVPLGPMGHLGHAEIQDDLAIPVQLDQRVDLDLMVNLVSEDKTDPRASATPEVAPDPEATVVVQATKDLPEIQESKALMADQEVPVAPENKVPLETMEIQAKLVSEDRMAPPDLMPNTAHAQGETTNRSRILIDGDNLKYLNEIKREQFIFLF